MKHSILVTILFIIFLPASAQWQQLPGGARDIGAGANGSVWVIGTIAEGGGYGIYRWNGSNWDKHDGGAVGITVANDGNPWVVNSEGNIYRMVNGAWQQLSGGATDIGAGANGSVWIIGTDAQGSDYGIYRWDGYNWIRVEGAAVKVAVDENGRPWVVNSSGNIYRMTDGSWQQMPGRAKDIGVGGGAIWVIGWDSEGADQGIYKWNGSDWNRIDGGAVRIAVDNRGNPWVVNSSGSIYYNGAPAAAPSGAGQPGVQQQVETPRLRANDKSLFTPQYGGVIGYIQVRYTDQVSPDGDIQLRVGSRVYVFPQALKGVDTKGISFDPSNPPIGGQTYTVSETSPYIKFAEKFPMMRNTNNSTFTLVVEVMY